MSENVIIKEKGKIGFAPIGFILLGIFCFLYGGGLIGEVSSIEMENLFLTLGAVFSVLGIFFIIMLATSEICVTSKRVYGKVAFGRRVDLPIDSISAISTTSVFTQGVSVSTSSGRITFYGLSKKEEIATQIRKLLNDRQDKPGATTTIHQEVSNADELKKYKELLDSGIITQEDFDAKKKQILGL